LPVPSDVAGLLSLLLLVPLAAAFLVMGAKRQRWERAATRLMRDTASTCGRLGREMGAIKALLQSSSARVPVSFSAVRKATSNDNPLTPRKAVPKKPAAKPAAPPQPSAPESKAEFSDAVLAELLRAAVRSGTVESVAQAVFNLSLKTPVFYELFSRLRVREGTYLPASGFMHVAEREGIAEDLDFALLSKAIALTAPGAHSPMATCPVMLNLSPSSLGNAPFMAGLLPALERRPAFSSRLILDIGQGEMEGLTGKQTAILTALSQAGVRIALDRVGKLPESPQSLRLLGVRFIKLDGGRIMATSSRDDGRERLDSLRDACRDAGIALIARNLETAAQVARAGELGIPFGQGYALARPAPVRSALSSSPAASGTRA